MRAPAFSSARGGKILSHRGERRGRREGRGSHGSVRRILSDFGGLCHEPSTAFME